MEVKVIFDELKVKEVNDIGTVKILMLKGEKGEAGSGNPVAVGTVAEMIDTTEIYLYTGSESGYTRGHWYYYNGSAWVDGGQYGADGSINNNARNLLKYILERVAYIETDMQVYVQALYEALKATDTPPTSTYTILNTLVNVTNSNTATTISEGSAYSGTLSIEAGYTMESVTITMGGVDITSTAYNSSTKVISIASVTGDIVIIAQASAPVTRYLITNALVHVTNSNTDTGIDEGESYSATLTADTDYAIDSVVVTMGGVDITATAYDSSDDSITIASVTGDIVITATATYWDYEWYASSGVAPSFMNYASCIFAQDNSYATIHLNTNTDLFVLDDVGDMKMEFAVGFPGSYNNNPQFVVRTSATGGFKVFPSTSPGVVSTNISGSTATLPVADRTALNIYKMHIVSGACSLEYGTSESSLTTLTGSGQIGSSYYPKTGVTGALQSGGYDLKLVYFRYKKL